MNAIKPIEQLTDAELIGLAEQASRLADAPESWVNAAVGLWKVAPHRAANPKSGLLTRFAAALSFDSWATPALALGMRSTALDNRHLLFSAKGRDIDVRISLSSDRFALAGQVLGPDESGVVELTRQGDAMVATRAPTASLNELGEFRFDSVDPGTYLLAYRAGGDEIVLPPIVIGTTGECSR